jgi:spermidine synthase
MNAFVAWKLAAGWEPAPEAAGPAPAASATAPARRGLPAKKKADKRRQAPAAAEYPPVPGPAAGIELPSAALYAIAGLAGFVFFLMELVWYRMLAPILGGSTYTLGLILAVALAGIGAGAALYPLVYRDRRPDLRSLALTLAWEALAIALPFALGDRLAILALILRSLAVYGFLGQVLGWLVVAGIVVFPAALVSGIQFPVLIALIGEGRANVGKQLGQAFGWNTVGAMAGSLAGGFGLLSLLTAPGVWKLAVILLAASAVFALVLELRRGKEAGRMLQPLALVALAALCLTALGPTAGWRHGGIGAGRAALPGQTRSDLRAFLNGARRHILWEADGRESSVAISVQNGIAFIVSGKSDGNSVTDAPTQVMLGVLAALLHQGPRDGLVIGLGTGESAGWLASLPAIERVDVVELEPAILEVARVCAPMNHDVLAHPKIHLVLNDAREVLQTTGRRYDIIASEPSNPYRTGVSSLYTREFYRAARQRLRPGGIFVQWLQGYEIDQETVRIVLGTLGDTFPNVEIWETNHADLLLVCSAEPLVYSADDLKRRIVEPAMARALLAAWRTTTVEGVLAHLVADRRYSAAVADQPGALINRDDRNILEYSFARTVGRIGGLTNSALRSEAIAAGLHRPLQLKDHVDWERVEDCRVASYALVAEAPLAGAMFGGDRAKRADALAALVLRSDPQEAVRLWESQPKPPYDVPETLAVALAYAMLGNERAQDLVAPVAEKCPIEAKAIAAVLAARQNQYDRALALIEETLAALRRDATPNRYVLHQVFLAAAQLPDKHPAAARPLYEAFQRPLSVYLFEDRRKGMLFLFGARLGGQAFVDAALALEPHPPWEATILAARVRAYEQANHPNLARARRELAELRGMSPEARVLSVPAAAKVPNPQAGNR